MPLAAALPAIVGGVAAVGAAAISSNAQKSAAKSAANAQSQASAEQIALQREQLARAQAMAQPYVDAGKAADTSLDARWRSGNAPQAQTPYGDWSARPASAYDRGAPTPAWTPQGAPQVAQPAAYALPAAQATPTAWHPSQVNFTGFPPLPGRTTTQPAPNPGQGAPTSAYGNWVNNYGRGLPNYTAFL